MVVCEPPSLSRLCLDPPLYLLPASFPVREVKSLFSCKQSRREGQEDPGVCEQASSC